MVFTVGDENSGKLDAEMNTKAMENWSQRAEIFAAFCKLGS